MVHRGLRSSSSLCSPTEHAEFLISSGENLLRPKAIPRRSALLKESWPGRRSPAHQAAEHPPAAPKGTAGSTPREHRVRPRRTPAEGLGLGKAPPRGLGTAGPHRGGAGEAAAGTRGPRRRWGRCGGQAGEHAHRRGGEEPHSLEGRQEEPAPPVLTTRPAPPTPPLPARPPLP